MEKLFIILLGFVLMAHASPLTGNKELALMLFDSFNLNLWKHEITLLGCRNWEFQCYQQ